MTALKMATTLAAIDPDRALLGRLVRKALDTLGHSASAPKVARAVIRRAPVRWRDDPSLPLAVRLAVNEARLRGAWI